MEQTYDDIINFVHAQIVPALNGLGKSLDSVRMEIFTQAGEVARTKEGQQFVKAVGLIPAQAMLVHSATQAVATPIKEYNDLYQRLVDAYFTVSAIGRAVDFKVGGIFGAVQNAWKFMWEWRNAAVYAYANYTKIPPTDSYYPELNKRIKIIPGLIGKLDDIGFLGFLAIMDTAAENNGAIFQRYWDKQRQFMDVMQEVHGLFSEFEKKYKWAIKPYLSTLTPNQYEATVEKHKATLINSLTPWAQKWTADIVNRMGAIKDAESARKTWIVVGALVGAAVVTVATAGAAAPAAAAVVGGTATVATATTLAVTAAGVLAGAGLGALAGKLVGNAISDLKATFSTGKTYKATPAEFAAKMPELTAEIFRNLARLTRTWANNMISHYHRARVVEGKSDKAALEEATEKTISDTKEKGRELDKVFQQKLDIASGAQPPKWGNYLPWLIGGGVAFFVLPRILSPKR